MAIINSAVKQGVELKATENGSIFVADSVALNIGSYPVTQNLLIGVAFGAVVTLLLKG